MDFSPILEEISIELTHGDPETSVEGAERIASATWMRLLPKDSAAGLSLTRVRSGPGDDYLYIWSIGESGVIRDPGEWRRFLRLLDSPDVRSRLSAASDAEEVRAILLGLLPFSDAIEDSGEPHDVVGRIPAPFGGVLANIRGKLPHYASDYTDAFNLKALAAVIFMYFACLAPAIAFGGLLANLTNGELGVVEMMVATAVCGILYPLFAGQPITILGSTGPVIIFIGLLFDVCQRWNLPFLVTLAWVGLWTSLILIVLAATEASVLIRWFTRFTDEIFAALISIIFIAESLGDSLGGVRDPAVPRDSAYLGLILALGTYIIAIQLADIRRGPYLKAFFRNLLADFGPVIAIASMVGVAFLLRPTEVETLALPPSFGTTSGRPWLIDLWAAPVWVRFAAVVPALLVSVLLFVDQNITVRLVNSRRHPIRKGFGYHLDMLLVGLLVGVCSLFGLPWMVAATVRSLNHFQSLADTQRRGDDTVVVNVLENRLTALLIHILIACSLFFLDELRPIPMPVLFGLFLYMGVASLRGNQFFERARLWLMDPEAYPSTYYLRTVPTRVVHAFTAIQAALLALLWILKTSAIGILFPLLIALLVPIRFLLDRFFEPRHLARLDGEEVPSEEKEHVLGP